MKAKKILSAVLAGAMLTAVVLPCYASTTKEKLEQVQKQQQQTESTLSGTKERLDRLESKKGQSESYLTELNSQLEELKGSLAQLQADYDTKQEELKQVQQELEEAQQREAKQYQDMKLRIQYMYERSDDNYLEMLFSSESLADFLSRTNNISMLSEYDRNLLHDYRSVREEVALKEQRVIDEQNAIKVLQEESLERQEEVDALIEITYNEIRVYQMDISEAESEESRLLEQISAQEEEINKLLKQAKDEEARKAEEEKKKQEAAQNQAGKPSVTNKPSASVPKPDNGSSNNSSNNNNAAGGSGSDNTGSSNTGSSDTDGEKGNSNTWDVAGADKEQEKYLGRFKLTAYCACEKCCGKWSQIGLTASGTKPVQGRTVAMSGVPFGTKLLINGHVYTVEDRGTPYGHVDVFFSSHSDALQFGKKYADVYQVN